MGKPLSIFFCIELHSCFNLSANYPSILTCHPTEFYVLQYNNVGGLGASHCGGESTTGIFEPDPQFAATEAGTEDPFTILSPARDLSVSK
jgi:hypothetical protein